MIIVLRDNCDQSPLNLSSDSATGEVSVYLHSVMLGRCQF